jgi:hypothetical protein
MRVIHYKRVHAFERGLEIMELFTTNGLSASVHVQLFTTTTNPKLFIPHTIYGRLEVDKLGKRKRKREFRPKPGKCEL